MTSPLTQEVQPGDLILLFTSKQRRMLHVASATEQSPSKILVKHVPWSMVYHRGYWVLNGPEVCYFPPNGSEEGEDDDDDGDDGDSTTISTDSVSTGCEYRSLQTILDTYGNDVTLIVNPHGRQVLEHYFQGFCPHCGHNTWFCPGYRCNQYFPTLHAGGCAIDLSCPVCLGLDFAEEDLGRYKEIEHEQSRIGHIIRCRSSPRSESQSPVVYSTSITDEELQLMKEEYYQLVRERYELINEMKQEMGLPLDDDVDKLVADYSASWEE